MNSHRSDVLASMLKHAKDKILLDVRSRLKYAKIYLIRTDFCIMIHDSQPITGMKIRVLENSAATPLYLYMYILIVYI